MGDARRGRPRKAAEVLDAAGAAELLGVSEQVVRRLAREGRIPAAKVGGAWRFERAALQRWVADSGRLDALGLGRQGREDLDAIRRAEGTGAAEAIERALSLYRSAMEGAQR